ALHFYGVKQVRAFQLRPDAAHWTNDVPDMCQPWNPVTASSWRWMHEEWTYPIPLRSVGITNLKALRGERVTEAARWEEDEWEIFAGAGPDVPKEDIRVVPLGVLLASDDSMLPVVNLAVGDALWRDAKSDWHRWVKREQRGTIDYPN
ncbi:MAG TPA: hypothetical protein VIM00_05820, partial [Candidatus Acidoferrum sp.]